MDYYLAPHYSVSKALCETIELALSDSSLRISAREKLKFQQKNLKEQYPFCLPFAAPGGVQSPRLLERVGKSRSSPLTRVGIWISETPGDFADNMELRVSPRVKI
jgi:hypothetical protein